MMQKLLIAFTLLITSCNTVTEKKENKPLVHTDIASSVVNDTEVVDTTQYATYYLLIADTGKDYYALDQKMYELSKSMKLEIDTMNRYYNKKKDNIVLPDNDEDEIYRGEYFPRRFPSETLSLEYLNVFDEKAGRKTIALVAGMYEAQHKADSMQPVLKKHFPKAYILMANVYIGCMH